MPSSGSPVSHERAHGGGTQEEGERQNGGEPIISRAAKAGPLTFLWSIKR